MSDVKSCNSSNSSRFCSSSELFFRSDTASKLARYATARNPTALLRNHKRMFSYVGMATDVRGILPLYTNAVVKASVDKQKSAVKNAICCENRMLATMITRKYNEAKLLSCNPVEYTIAVIMATSPDTCNAPNHDAVGSNRTRIRCRIPMVIHKTMIGRKDRAVPAGGEYCGQTTPTPRISAIM